ncbi:MAG: DUF1080 domain-containing protein [Planctomycetes bacterium]|nr:DUF1080 domain-containing protein [Planctomycetota bacterium]
MRALVGPLWLLALLPGCAVAPAPSPWNVLFDGKELGAFAVTDFGGQGDVAVRDGAIEMGFGSPLTGITWTGPAPTDGYELEVVAARIDGGDFFAGITFPVGDAFLTLVLGGWGGSLCGLSSLDGNDAAHNDARCHRQFEDGRDYAIRIVVTADAIATFLDGAPLARAERAAHRLGLRPEVLLSRPLGIASFATASRVRSVRWRTLP